MVLLAWGIGSRCVPHIQVYVLARYSMKDSDMRAVGEVAWLSNLMLLTLSNSPSLSSLPPQKGSPAVMTSQLRHRCPSHVVAVSACWIQLLTTIIAQTQPMPGLMVATHNQHESWELQVPEEATEFQGQLPSSHQPLVPCATSTVLACFNAFSNSFPPFFHSVLVVTDVLQALYVKIPDVWVSSSSSRACCTQPCR